MLKLYTHPSSTEDMAPRNGEVVMLASGQFFLVEADEPTSQGWYGTLGQWFDGGGLAGWAALEETPGKIVGKFAPDGDAFERRAAWVEMFKPAHAG